MSMMAEAIPFTTESAPRNEPDGGEEDDPLCFKCLVGTCLHHTTHARSAVTALRGTLLCQDCAYALRDTL